MAQHELTLLVTPTNTETLLKFLAENLTANIVVEAFEDHGHVGVNMSTRDTSVVLKIEQRLPAGIELIQHEQRSLTPPNSEIMKALVNQIQNTPAMLSGFTHIMIQGEFGLLGINEGADGNADCAKVNRVPGLTVSKQVEFPGVLSEEKVRELLASAAGTAMNKATEQAQGEAGQCADPCKLSIRIILVEAKINGDKVGQVQAGGTASLKLDDVVSVAITLSGRADISQLNIDLVFDIEFHCGPNAGPPSLAAFDAEPGMMPASDHAGVFVTYDPHGASPCRPRQAVSMPTVEVEASLGMHGDFGSNIPDVFAKEWVKKLDAIIPDEITKLMKLLARCDGLQCKEGLTRIQQGPTYFAGGSRKVGSIWNLFGPSAKEYYYNVYRELRVIRACEPRS